MQDERPPPVPGLSPRDEAAQLLGRYTELVDDGDFAGVGRLLGTGSVVLADGTVLAAGAAAIQRLYEATTRRFDDGTPHTHHVVTDVIVEPSTSGAPGREAYEVRARFTVLQATVDLPLQPIVVGRYRDVMARDADGRLAFVEHGMDPTLWGDVGQHLLIDPPDGPADA